MSDNCNIWILEPDHTERDIPLAPPGLSAVKLSGTKQQIQLAKQNIDAFVSQLEDRRHNNNNFNRGRSPARPQTPSSDRGRSVGRCDGGSSSGVHQRPGQRAADNSRSNAAAEYERGRGGYGGNDNHSSGSRQRGRSQQPGQRAAGHGGQTFPGRHFVPAQPAERQFMPEPPASRGSVPAPQGILKNATTYTMRVAAHMVSVHQACYAHIK